MKKMVAFVVALALACTNLPANLNVQPAAETVYAAQAVANNATFKNIVMTSVTIQGKEAGAALVQDAEKCNFSKITVSGKATTGGAGIACLTTACNFTDCTSKVDANVKSTEEELVTLSFAGIAMGNEDTKFKNCKNKGNITLTGKASSDSTLSAYGIADLTNKIENCVNSGNITIKNTANGSPTPKALNYFPDVKSKDSYYKAALWAVDKGLIEYGIFEGQYAYPRGYALYYVWQSVGAPKASKKSTLTDYKDWVFYADAVA